MNFNYTLSIIIVFNRTFGKPNDPDLDQLTEGLQDTEDLADIFGESSDDRRLGALSQCGCHKLSLVSSSDVKKLCSSQYPDYFEVHTTALSKITSLWSAQNSSTVFAEEVKTLFGSLFDVGCETRWFSKFEAIKDFLKKRKAHPIPFLELYERHPMPSRIVRGVRVYFNIYFRF